MPTNFGQFDYGNALAQLNAKYANQGGAMAYDRYRNELAGLERQRIATAATSAAGAPVDDAAAKAQRAHDELFGLARGRLDELRGDNTDQMVLNALRERSGANAGPYDPTTVNALMTGASAQAQQSERNALAQLAKTGLSPSDPAYQAAANEILARRQASNQQARLGIQQNANVANYGARGQALGQLGSFNSMRNAGITDAQRYLGGLLAADTYVQPEPSMDWNQALAQQQYAYNQNWMAQQGQQGQQQQAQSVARPTATARPPTIAANQQGFVQYSRPAGPPSPTSGAIRVGGSAAPTGQSYINGFNTTTGVQQGTGYVQLSGQPQTRINYGTGVYNPSRPTY